MCGVCRKHVVHEATFENDLSQSETPMGTICSISSLSEAMVRAMLPRNAAQKAANQRLTEAPPHTWYVIRHGVANC